MSCVHPDGATSNKVLLTDCIFQYRDKVGEGYGSSYACVGVPQEYINRFIVDAQRESTVNLKAGDKVENKNGYFWINAKTDELTVNKTLIMYVDEAGEDQGIPKRLDHTGRLQV